MDKKDHISVAAMLCPAGCSLPDAGTRSGLRRGSDLPAWAACELEHTFVELFFHLSAESTLEAACSEFHPVCPVSTEETGKEVEFNVF